MLQTSMLLFFGYMGSIIFVCGGAVGLVALMAGARLGTLTWPVFWAIVGKGLLDNVLSDYLWARAILLIGEGEGDWGRVMAWEGVWVVPQSLGAPQMQCFGPGTRQAGLAFKGSSTAPF